MTNRRNFPSNLSILSPSQLVHFTEALFTRPEDLNSFTDRLKNVIALKSKQL